MGLISFSEKQRIPTYNDPSQHQGGAVIIDYEKCSGCLLCVKLCPADALAAENKKPVMVPPEKNECMACGDCAAFCEEQAIRIARTLKSSGRYKTIDHGVLRLPTLA